MTRFNVVVLVLLALAMQLPIATVVRAADPTLKNIGPATISVGDPDFSLRVAGENFDDGSVVLLDGVAVQTSFLSKTRLYGKIPAAVSNATGTHTIAVRNSAGMTTANLTLTVGTADPNVVIERVNPDSLGVITTGQGAEFRLAGEGFNDKSKVFAYGKAYATTLREKGVLAVLLTSDVISVAGIIPLQVKPEGGGFSQMITVPVYDKTATISSLDPLNVDAGAEEFTLKINGTGFEQAATVLVGDTVLTPTSVKSQEIKVTIPATVVANVAQLIVYVSQSTGLSNASVLRVVPADGSPLVYTVNPITVQVGAGATTVDVSGANFEDKSTVLVNGVEAKTTFFGKSAVSFKLTDTQTGTEGVVYAVQVKNKDGAVSNAATVTIVPAALVSTLSGLKLDGFVDGSPDEAKFRRPSRMAVGPDGMIYVADQLNHAVRRLNPATGFVETIAGTGTPGYIDTGDSTKPDFVDPKFNNPLGIVVSPAGVIYVSDFGNNVIRRLTPSGSTYVVDTVAGANELIKNADQRQATHSTRRGLSGFANGAGSIARFRGVDGMSLASNGTLYVADASNQYIRSVDTASSTFDVATVSGLGIAGFNDGTSETARYTTPTDVSVSADDSTLYVADFGNNRIRQIDLATGVVTTLAGNGQNGSSSGTRLQASFDGPIGVAATPMGTVFVADNGSATIRRISPEGITTTLAGQANKTKFKDGIGPLSRFKFPRGLVFSTSRLELFIADQSHQRIRSIVPE